MKNLHHRTFEKILTSVFIFAILWGSFGPVRAEADNEVETDNKSSVVATPEEAPLPAKATRFVTATAYSSDVWQNDNTPFLPANGVDYREVYAKTGKVDCVALNDLPLGTVIRITDERVVNVFGTEKDKQKKAVYKVVCDRKNARYNGGWSMDMYTTVAINNKIDSQASLDEARRIAKQFGVQRKVKIEVIEYGTRATRTRYVYPLVSTEVNQSTKDLAVK